VIDVLTVAALALAWFIYRLERHSGWRAEVDAAYGSLQAVHHGMVEGVTESQPDGWGQLYFLNEYTPAAAQARAAQTYHAMMGGGFDEVFVVPTEPLAKLATATPNEGFISNATIAAANFALWRVHVFNQLVQQLTDFNTAHAAEVESATGARRKELANAAAALSRQLHGDGIGRSWTLPDGSPGWYKALVDAIDKNMNALDTERRQHAVHWLLEWHIVVDCVALGALIGALVGAAG
jgi:hypothetical protein